MKNEKLCGKLVRDKLPRMLESDGMICETEQLEAEEYANCLLQVLEEENAKFKQAFCEEDDELAVKKIADIVEVLYAVLDLIGVEKSSFEKIRLARYQKYGGYQNKTLLKK